MRCPYQAGVRMQGLTAVDVNLVNIFYDTAHIKLIISKIQLVVYY